MSEIHLFVVRVHVFQFVRLSCECSTCEPCHTTCQYDNPDRSEHTGACAHVLVNTRGSCCDALLLIVYTCRTFATRPPKLVPTFADRGCHVVSLTVPYGRILGFLDRSRYFSFQVAPQLYSRGWVDPVPDPLLLRKSGSSENRTRTSGSAARNSDHWTTETATNLNTYTKNQCVSALWNIFSSYETLNVYIPFAASCIVKRIE
jgi:hypothetical protein